MSLSTGQANLLGCPNMETLRRVAIRHGDPVAGLDQAGEASSVKNVAYGAWQAHSLQAQGLAHASYVWELSDEDDHRQLHLEAKGSQM